MTAPEEIRAWRPAVPGVVEAFHARFVDHVYPMHTHDTWTLLILDSGGIRYDLDIHEHGSLGRTVTLLPPHVPHSGSSIRPEGFRKRVLYLAEDSLSTRLVGRAVDSPVFADGLLRDRISRLHAAIAEPGRELEAESRLSLIADRLLGHLSGELDLLPRARDPRLAWELRDLLDAHLPEGLTLEEASAVLHADPAYLVRVFSRQFGMGPHQYLTGRRIDVARHLLLAGMPAAQVAQAAGFYDQSHLTRHFKRFLGITPARFAQGGGKSVSRPEPPADTIGA
ncbi:MAG TPA: AraC family transcriptional regulator [Actinospica sp.]|nr:AraC family transcriptional regulator [Actinospica sp.]